MSFSGADAAIVLGTFSGICFLCGIIRLLDERHQVGARDSQEVPIYSRNCPPKNTGQEQGAIQDKEAHLAEQNDESFDEDARTIVGEENERNNSIHSAATDNSQGLSGSNGQKLNGKASFDGESGTITGEAKYVSSVDLTERGCSGDRYDVPKDDGPLFTRKGLGEGNEWTSVDLNEGSSGR